MLDSRTGEYSVKMPTATPNRHRSVAVGTICLMAALICAYCGWIISLHNPGAHETIAPVFNKSGPNPDIYNAVGLYSHFDEIFPSHKIRRSDHRWLFKYSQQPLRLSYDFGGRPSSLTDFISRNPTTGLLIAKDDTILYETYQYGQTDQSRFLAQSMSKTVVAMLVGVAIEDRYIRSIDDRVEIYLPRLRGTEYGRTPIKDLLHMASGVRFIEDTNGHDDLAQLNRDLLYGNVTDPLDAILRYNIRIRPPGTKYYYASIESEILGLIVQSATHRSLGEYLQTKLWGPIGAEADAAWTVDASGHEIAFCCLSAVLRDYARLGRLLALDGTWEGRQVIPLKWVLDATQVAPTESYLSPGIAMRYFGYGYQVRILPGQRRMVELHGLRGQAIFVDPLSRLVMVTTSVLQPTNAADEESLLLWQAVLQQLGGYQLNMPANDRPPVVTGWMIEVGRD